MDFDTDLIEATFVRRYKRFFVDALLADGTEVVAHTANTGSMRGLLGEGRRVMLSPNMNPKAKLDWRLELIEDQDSWVGVNTARANRIAEEALGAGRIAELARYQSLKREVTVADGSRLDFLLRDPLDDGGTGHCYVEVKSVTLREGSAALFPDAVTSRGAKHLRSLMDLVGDDTHAAMLFIIQRDDCSLFRPAAHIDPTYADALRHAAAAGVQILAYVCSVTPQGIAVDSPLPIDLSHD